jgi:hypothetical protein
VSKGLQVFKVLRDLQVLQVSKVLRVFKDHQVPKQKFLF